MREAGCGSCGLRTVNLCVTVSHRVTKVSHESVPQERSTRVSPTRVSKNVWALVFEYVFALGFVSSILYVFFDSLTYTCQKCQRDRAINGTNTVASSACLGMASKEKDEHLPATGPAIATRLEAIARRGERAKRITSLNFSVCQLGEQWDWEPLLFRPPQGMSKPCSGLLLHQGRILEVGKPAQWKSEWQRTGTTGSPNNAGAVGNSHRKKKGSNLD